MAFYNWSTTAASNATADPTINWAEGMAPSAVNDSARATMAGLAQWGADISGSVTTTGTSTAYVFNSNQNFDTLAHMNGAMLCFVAHTTSGAGSPSVTLNVDGLGALPIYSGSATNIPTGTLIQGTPYTVTYLNSLSAFFLHGFYASPYIIPIGAMLDYTATVAPSSAFVLPAGQAISRTTYATYFSLVSTTFGSGDGSTTFNVPDLRGRVCASLDNLNGTAIGRISTSLVTDSGTINGQVLGSAGGSQNHAQVTNEIAEHSHPNSLSDPGHTHDNHIGISGSVAGGTDFFRTVINTAQGNQTGSSVTGIAINNANAGSGSPMAWLQPTIMMGKILRVI